MAKTINGSVGFRGMNQPKDVMVVQYLLNCVPVQNGGPATELVIDGIAGPKTVQAIQQFQNVNRLFADGRVDPDGQTLRELHKFDPYPQESVNPVAIVWDQKKVPKFSSQKGYGVKTLGESAGGQDAGSGTKGAPVKVPGSGKNWSSGGGFKSTK